MDTENINADLIPVANAGLKLFVSEKGAQVRKNLLLSLVKDDRLEFKDAEKLLDDFIERYFENYGSFQDAINKDDTFMFHSLLSPVSLVFCKSK